MSLENSLTYLLLSRIAIYPINDYSKSIATREIYLRGLISQTNGRDGLVGIIQYFFRSEKGWLNN